jgi:hypothetical protein
MALNSTHTFEEVDGIKCSIVEKNVSPARVEFLKALLELNGYTVVVAGTPPPKAKPAPAPKEGEAPAPVEPPPAPTTFTQLFLPRIGARKKLIRRRTIGTGSIPASTKTLVAFIRQNNIAAMVFFSSRSLVR